MNRRNFLKSAAGWGVVAVAASVAIKAGDRISINFTGTPTPPVWGVNVKITELYSIERKTGLMTLMGRYYETPSGKVIPI